MLATTLIAAFVGFAAAAPSAARRATTLSDEDGWPNPTQSQSSDIQNKAGGQLPSGAPVLNTSTSITMFQLLAINEQFEVAFFTSLLSNITNNVTGFSINNPVKRATIIDILATIKAQEQMHSQAVTSALQKVTQVVPAPCQYIFPTTTIRDAFTFAASFTALSLGTLQDVAHHLAEDSNGEAVRAIASVIGEEGEQQGFYRSLLAKRPAEKPFLTGSIASFTFSILSNFIVYKSCPFQADQIPLKTFPALAVQNSANVTCVDQTINFAADLTNSAAAQPHIGKGGDLFITYLNGQSAPYATGINNIKWNMNVIYFSAYFPCATNNLRGFSIAALTTENVFSDGIESVQGLTLAGPGLITASDYLPGLSMLDL